MSVGMWRIEIQTPARILIKIFPAHPHLSKEDFGAVLIQSPSTPLTWGGG